MKLVCSSFTFTLFAVFLANINYAYGNQDNACYTPTPAGATITGQWNAANAENFHNIQIPSDPGGGYVTVSLTTNKPQIRPRIKVKDVVSPGRKDGDIVVAQRGKDDTGITKASFEVSPNQPLRITAGQFFNADRNQYPAQYSLQWQYFSKVDCYEPNNSAAEAKEIQIGQAIRATMLAGMSGNTLNIPGQEDWYQFTVDSPRRLAIVLAQLPTNIKFKLDVYLVKSNGTLQTIKGVNLAKGAVAGGLDPLEFQPGTYKIRLSAFLYGDFSVTNDKPLPDHFNRRYGLIIVPR
jgi:hypothetical protein